MCEDGNPPLTNYLAELESKVDRLELNITEFEAEIEARQVDLSGADLSNANMSNANLPFVNLTGANLLNANLAGANLADIIWGNTICPDGSNSDTNGLNGCVAIKGQNGGFLLQPHISTDQDAWKNNDGRPTVFNANHE